MKFIFSNSLFKCVLLVWFVSEICCDLQVLQYPESKEISALNDNDTLLTAVASNSSSLLNTQSSLKTIKSNRIVTRRRRKKRRKKKKEAITQSTNIISILETKHDVANDNLLHSTLTSTRRPRRRRIKKRRKMGKRKQTNNSVSSPSSLKRKNNTSYKSPTLMLGTKSLILPVAPTPTLPSMKNKSRKVQKAEIKNTRCSKNNGGCAHLCLLKGTQKCQCFKGFTLAEDKMNCIDNNECVINRHACQMNCTNTIGSYRCHCPRGLRLGLDSKSCEDVNECLLRNGHGPCQDTCENTYGGYKCNCNGLKGTKLGNDLHSCLDVDECSKENGGCSHICINAFGRSFCSCPEGWELSLDFKTCKSTDLPRILL